MRTVYDVQQHLKRFGTFIYTGDRKSDLEMMRSELKEMFTSQMIDTKDFQAATIVINSAIAECDRK
ncbi:MAG: YqgQ family protein [Bacilli bacterium]